jgi:hypothetical protein
LALQFSLNAEKNVDYMSIICASVRSSSSDDAGVMPSDNASNPRM